MNKLFKYHTLCVMCLLLSVASNVFAQSRPPAPIQVLVSPDKADWNYKIGEEATFRVTVLQHQVPVSNIKVSYSIGPEKMAAYTKGESVIKDGNGILVKSKMTKPGFLRCDARVTVNGTMYRGIATAAYQPLDIKPTQTLPADFWEFWQKSMAEARKLPLDPLLTLIPDRCTEKTNVYELSFQNQVSGSRIYGILCVPKAPGKYPALLQVPGAGIRPYPGLIALADSGMITLQIGIHGISVTSPAALYSNLTLGALRDYYYMNLDDRDRYYYKRVYLGCVRAVDYLATLSQYDGSNLGVWGGSQGGALSIVTAALDKRIKYLAVQYPALCDLTGYLNGRAGGWPHPFAAQNSSFLAKEEKIKVSAYYDVVNFARGVDAPGLYAWGYNDDTVPPTSFYAAYNVIKATKELRLVQETGHWTYPEQMLEINDWLLNKLLKNKK
ncbi:acetylxylan esterase [Pedobacter metabolipauper]|uniref:Cephalosporin-C deacetylase-like acetyl esterase n=1 Tax=Pedobacter metabolipauper TaxID=425513 RepID=A0A4R6SY81_9SPHI|nr:acetylxylan esterase [Pedobacter metabolipauper]TDQ11514.1 cephalosporin-C deacetylase-like acetyl esterase [Pedobacter metabolipauper]